MRVRIYTNRRVYITGGSSGIGYAIAQSVLSDGGEVLLLARGEQRLEEARQRLVSSGFSREAIAIQPVDISDESAVFDAVGDAVKSFGPADILINCAGMAYPDHVYTMDRKMAHQTIKVNLLGTMNMIGALLPHLKPGARIVNVSSVAGFIGTYGYTAYSASKFGIIGYSQALRNELKPEGVAVHVLCPPDTDTPQLEAENKTKPPETFAISGNASLKSPESVASALRRGLEKKRFMIIAGFDSRLIYLLTRLFPSLVFFIMDRIVASSRKREGVSRRFLHD